MIFFSSSFLTRPNFPAAVLAAAGSLLRRGIAVSRVLGGCDLPFAPLQGSRKARREGEFGKESKWPRTTSLRFRIAAH